MTANSEQLLPTASAPPARPSFWNDPVYRGLVFQAVVLVAVVALGVFLVSNTMSNLERQGIASGFGFLERTAGFSIGESLVAYTESNSYGRTFVVGLLNTIWVSFWGIVLATIIGFVMGVLRLSNNWLVSKMAMVYIEALRNIPLLLQIFFWYFAVLRPLPGPRQSVTVGESFFSTTGDCITRRRSTKTVLLLSVGPWSRRSSQALLSLGGRNDGKIERASCFRLIGFR